MYLVIRCIGSSSYQRKSGKIIDLLPDSFHGALNLYEDDIMFKSTIPNFTNSLEVI